MPDRWRVFPGDSEMARLMRAFDWTQTPLGATQTWPRNLRTCIRITLTSRQPMFVWWGDQLIHLYNDGYAEFLHRRHPWALGQPAAEVWPEIWEQIGPRAEFARQQDTGTYDEALPFIMLRKGYPEEAYVTFSYSPIPNDDGGFGGILCPVTEETRRIVGERQLALLRELGERTAEARTPAAACELAAAGLATNPHDLPFALLYLLDGDGRALTLAGSHGLGVGHPAAPERLEVRQPSVWPIQDVLEWHRPRVVSNLSTLADPMPARGVYQVDRGVVLPLLAGRQPPHGVLIAGLNPLREYDDRYRQFLELVGGALGVAIKNAQAHQAERSRTEALTELDREKTEFFNNVSHEFRTPLTLILGPLEEELRASKASANLEVVHRNALRLLKLVNTLLEFSRIEAGRVEAAYTPTDLSALTADLTSVFRSAIEKAGMRLTVDCPPLPEPVYVDPHMWEQIVLNLLSNAFRFTFQGEIGVTLRADAGRAVLTVRDTGGGIPAAEQPRVFERFYRVRNTRSRTHEGSGIGLALVQKLVALHGGEITVHSEVDRGTLLTVSIPLGQSHLPAERIVPAPISDEARHLWRAAFIDEAELWVPAAERLPAPAAPSEDGDAASPRSRVLLADDHADLRRYVAAVLHREHDVIAVGDGVAALAAIHEQHPDLVIADVMMPRLDGHELVRRLRADPATKHLPILLLSARAGEEARVEGLEKGADDYLVKPFGAHELRARVNAHLDLARARLAAMQALQHSNEHLEHTVAERTAALRASEARQAFLVRLGDALRPLADAEAIKTAAARTLGQHLRADRVYYSESDVGGAFLDHPREYFSSTDSAGLEKRPRTPDFSSWVIRQLRQGQPVVVSDTRDLQDPDLERSVAGTGVRAFVIHPFIKGGQLLAAVGLAQASPRKWTKEDIALTEETAERTWSAVERARAERALEEELAVIRRLQHLSATTLIHEDPAALYEAMLDAALGIMHADCASLQRLDTSAEPATLNLIASRGLSARARDAWQRLPAESATACGAALRSKQRIVVTNTEVSPFIVGSSEETNFRETGIRAIQSTPLVSRGGAMLGMLSTHWRSVHAPSPRQLLHFDVLARQVADLLEHLDSEAARRTTETQLRDSDRRKNEFLAILAHELRNPLAPLSTGLELIRVAGDTPEGVQRVRAAMERQVAHIVRLVDDLLDVSRITSGKIRLQRERVSLDNLVRMAVEAHRETLALGKQELRVSLPPTPVWLDVDPTRFVQVVSNLLHNAIKFTKGGDTILIAATLSPEKSGPGLLELTVRDSGAGISREMLGRMFELFAQGDDCTSHRGLGIGLALARTLMELHGGSIEAASDGPGRGSTFTIRMPVAEPAITKPSGPRERTYATSVRALVIDDNTDAADTLALLVQSLGGAAEVAYNGEAGVKKAVEFHPDAVFIDIGMPGIDGYETCRRIRQRLGQKVRLIALTGLSQAKDKEDATRAGFDLHVTKPADPARLRGALELAGARPGAGVAKQGGAHSDPQARPRD